ncbi:MAG: DUF559 domain-containing protein [Bdellovibrionaceae bacterium]|nr:DUF559 domain-containing protein [Pseudobdellovibrionaceae bacterium]
MSSVLIVPWEQRAKEDADLQRITWGTGAFNFLLSRTKEKYNHKAGLKRRAYFARDSDCAFPELSDEALKLLYRHACEKYQRTCQTKHEYSGFQQTPSERILLKTIIGIIKTHPKLKHLEIYPSDSQSSDMLPGLKMVVGNRVPDCLIFGLKTLRSSAVAIEVDGESHIKSSAKDELRNRQLAEMGLFTFEIQNDQVRDVEFLTQALLSMYQLRNGSFNKQILRAKRLIWVKTIACQLSLGEIEELVAKDFSIRLNLLREARAIANTRGYPRKIKSEVVRLGLRQKP